MKKRGSYRWLLWILLAVVLIGVALWNLLLPAFDRWRSAQAYDELADTYVEAGDQADEDWWATAVNVDFDKLQAENPDVIGWIRFDDQQALAINYPVLYSGDNQAYLRTDWQGNHRIAGSIFLEGLNKPDFSDYYNIIYGHNMKDGTMFSGLSQYRDVAFWQKNPYFTVYTPETAYRYQIFSCEEAENGSDVYQIGYQPGDTYQQFIDQMVQRSLVQTGIHPQSSNKVLTLSTCKEDGGDARFTVHAVCVDAVKTQ